MCCCSLSHDIQLFETLWTAACQASLSFTSSWSLLRLISIELMMPFNHLVLYHPLLLLPSNFPSIRIFSNELALHIHKSAADFLRQVLRPNFSRVFFPSTTIQKHQFFGAQLSLWFNSNIHMWLSKKKHSFDWTDLCWQSDVSAFLYTIKVHHSFSSKEQASFNFMAPVTLRSDFEAQENSL